MLYHSKMMGNFILFACVICIFLYVIQLFLPHITWNDPLYFLLFILLPIFILKWSFPRKSTAIKFSSIHNLKNIRPSWRVRAYFLLPFLKACGFCFVIVALARPQIGNDNTKITSEGIAIMMVVDVSNSMRALDFATREKRQNRLDVVKEVFQRFVLGSSDMGGRNNDLVGIVSFGGYPESKCPLTLDHNAVVSILQTQVKIPTPVFDSNRQLLNAEEFQTAIGDAIIIGTERLKNSSAKSKVMLLLTDGENTAGVSDPLESAKIARDFGVKIYTIGVGTNERVPYPVENAFGEEVLRSAHFPMNEEVLKEIAKTTKGKYFNARNKNALYDIYAEIDTLEKQEIKVTYLQYDELYLWFLIPGVLIILLEKLLANTVLRKMPQKGFLMDFVNKISLAFLCAIPLIFFLLFLSYRSRDKAMQKFASDEMLKKIVPGSDWGLRIWKMLLFSCGIAVIIIGIARPRWGLYFQDVQNYGRDVVVLLDLSKSMLAEDVQPTRIERAKKDIEDLVDALKGDRIALVAFAGRVETRCPLTLDYNFFKWALDECHPGVVALGGTAIGDAIREGIKLFDEEELQEDSRRTKAIVLITDGEDHETAPLEAAKLARKNNITIFTVGFGDDKQGARIPVTTTDGRKEYLRDSEGRIVWSRLNDQLLRQISLATKGGVYFPVKTRNINMVSVYRDYIAQMEAKVHQSAKKPQKKDRFQIFVLLGFIILLLESLVMEGSLRAKVTVLMMCVVLCGCSGEDNQAFSLNEQARKLYQSGEYEKAKEKFQEAEVASPENSTVLYNIANAMYKQKKWKEAKDYYQQSTYNVKNNNEQLFSTAFNEGCTYFREAQELMEKNSDKIQDIINLLQQSLRHFRKALQYKKEDAATLHNLRFVKLVLKNYLDKLHKKQQEQQKKQETIQALLALLRRNQIMINYQSKIFVREKHSLKELAAQQKKQMEVFDKLEKKLQEKMKAVKDENQANMFKMQMQMLRTSLENLAKKMQEDDKSVIEDQEIFLSSLDPFWELMASADLVINEDILLQTLVVNDLQSEEKDFANVVKTADDHQALAILSTTLFEKKFAELVTSIAEQKKMLQQKQNNAQGSNDPKLPEIDEKEVQRLTKQAMVEQGQAKKFLEETQQLPAEKEARKALETLQKIAEKLGAQKQPPQKQQQDKKKQQKKQQQKQQQDKKKQQQKQQQKQQSKKQSKQQAEKMLQKIKKRMKDNKEKKQQSDYNSIGVDNDW